MILKFKKKTGNNSVFTDVKAEEKPNPPIKKKREKKLLELTSEQITLLTQVKNIDAQIKEAQKVTDSLESHKQVILKKFRETLKKPKFIGLNGEQNCLMKRGELLFIRVPPTGSNALKERKK
jgi:hypothetical protein